MRAERVRYDIGAEDARDRARRAEFRNVAAGADGDLRDAARDAAQQIQREKPEMPARVLDVAGPNTNRNSMLNAMCRMLACKNIAVTIVSAGTGGLGGASTTPFVMSYGIVANGLMNASMSGARSSSMKTKTLAAISR